MTALLLLLLSLADPDVDKLPMHFCIHGCEEWARHSFTVRITTDGVILGIHWTSAKDAADANAVIGSIRHVTPPGQW